MSSSKRRRKSARWEREQRYRVRLKERAISATAKRCQECNAVRDLEFAHRVPTELQGRGRGSKQRYSDVIKHPTSYLRLCRSCHLDFDGGGMLNVA